MRANATKAMIRLARAEGGPFAKVVLQACEVGVVVPSILEAKLNAAGFHVAVAPRGELPEHGVKVHVTSGNDHGGDYDKAGEGFLGTTRIVASGRSHTEPTGLPHADALLQAMFQLLKDENPVEWFAIQAEDLANKATTKIGIVAPAAPAK